MTSDAAIRVDDVSFTYVGGAAPAVRNVSFEIARGEIFGFLGPSGAGKSTMQKVLMRLLLGHTGHVEALGRRLQDWDTDYYERIGVCFELPTNYRKLTARENLDFFAALYDGETHQSGALLDLVGLGGDADKRVEQFSKGMQIRLNFARALLHKPVLLFLDEPTAGLDPANARRIRDLIREQQAAGTTIFLTTHDMTVADELCDRVAFIVEGALGVVDAPAALKQRHGRRSVRVETEDAAGDGTHEFPLDGLGQDRAFLDLIASKRIRTIHSQEPTLEEIFIQVTGRGLE